MERQDADNQLMMCVPFIKRLRFGFLLLLCLLLSNLVFAEDSKVLEKKSAEVAAGSDDKAAFPNIYFQETVDI